MSITCMQDNLCHIDLQCRGVYVDQSDLAIISSYYSFDNYSAGENSYV